MRVVCLSDTHGLDIMRVPEGDMLVHAGDFCNRGTARDVLDFVTWARQQPFKYKVIIAGNHDLILEETIGKQLVGGIRSGVIAEPQEDVIYLEDTMVEIEGKKIYGTPWSRPFYDWAFMRQEEQLDQIFKSIPKGLDLLITHGPAYTHCDRVKYIPEGSTALLRAIERTQPRFHVCGHIHCSYGASKMMDTQIYNVAHLNDDYDAMALNAPVVFEI
jgi:predicted phosphodiesterase